MTKEKRKKKSIVLEFLPLKVSRFTLIRGKKKHLLVQIMENTKVQYVSKMTGSWYLDIAHSNHLLSSPLSIF